MFNSDTSGDGLKVCQKWNKMSPYPNVSKMTQKGTDINGGKEVESYGF